MIDPKQEQAVFYVNRHAAGKVKVAATDIDGILRGKTMRRDKFFSILDKGFGFCDVVLGSWHLWSDW